MEYTMSKFPARATGAFSALALALALAACQPVDEAADPAAPEDAAAGAADGEAIAGLPTEKDQVSYMVGMDLGESLRPIKDDVDLDTVVEAMRTSISEGEAKLTDVQRQAVRERFSKHLMEKRQAEAKAQAETNKAAGEAFLAENAKKEGVQVTESGLQYQVLEAGEGPRPDSDDLVRVHYQGALLDGTVFDSSIERGQPADIPVSQVVPGWQEGIALMPVGSKYRLWIPAGLAYGEGGTPGGPIPPNSTLVFEVELLEILDQPTQ
jgi:FKBP-type peptidyl-prolyl cis-trans isomerase FkpA/FKBP-type peptidyl-prolyl cis-trans isomerase FklB